MAKARTLVGLDVHATKIVAAVLDGETGELEFFTLGGESARNPVPPPRRAHQRARSTPRHPARGRPGNARLLDRAAELMRAAPPRAPQRLPEAGGARAASGGA